MSNRRRDELGVLQRRQVDEERPIPKGGLELGGRGEGEPRLPRPARSGEREQAHVVALKESRTRCQLQPSSNQRRQRAGKSRVLAPRDLEGWILPQDCALELLQGGTRLDSELLDEHTARRLIGVECLCLPAGAI